MLSDLNISVHLFEILITMLLANTFLGMIGGPQIILIIAVVLLLFGGRKIPELMRGLGSGIKEFKNATKEEEEKAQVEESSSKKS
jgi:sec-independent protein translocase protein TatA